jgi:peroxiredoxin
MLLNRIAFCIVVSICTLSCSNDAAKDTFSVTGEIKNIDDQDIYLEQLFFSQKDPEVLDTAHIKNGKFILTARSEEEGLYRLRMSKMDAGFLFINDKPAIRFHSDMQDVSLEKTNFNTPANNILKSLIGQLEERRKALVATDEKMKQLSTQKADSSLAIQAKLFNEQQLGYQDFVIRFIDTCSDPVVTMFALGYTRQIDPSLLKKSISGLQKRFPAHQGIASIVSQYNQVMEQVNKQPAVTKNEKPAVGSMAPDFTMNDVNDKPFSLKNLKGKYVLVDFWASWCGPCRGENPNVVAAYKKYKNRNFTVLGVSLDENKAAWLKAIKDDKLTWTHVSDLKGWNNLAVSLYGFDGIPYNVLLDTTGKIIATGLREQALDRFLENTLK